MTDAVARIEDRTEGRPPVPIFEAEPPVRLLRATITTDGAWWSGALAVPEDGGPAMLTLTRHGAEEEAATLTVPAREIAAVAELVAGLTGRRC